MLKVTHTEAGLYLDWVDQLAEDWIASQAILAVRTGQSLVIEHCSISLLLRAGLTGLRVLERLVRQEVGLIDLAICDREFVEVSLRGAWISSGDPEQSAFIAMLYPSTEALLLQLWQESQALPTLIWS